MEEQIRAQAAQIESIQADLQTKINRSKDLEDQLAQAIELAHSRDARHEEMLQKFDQLMRIHTGAKTRHNPSEQDGEDNESEFPTTPDRTNTTGPPPMKKSNNNASPHRNIYSIFRQQQSRQNSPRSRKQKDNPLTQPMETDEATRQLALGAKSSTQKE